MSTEFADSHLLGCLTPKSAKSFANVKMANFEEIGLKLVTYEGEGCAEFCKEQLVKRSASGWKEAKH